MKKWSEKTTFEKVLDVISGISLVVWLIFEWLERTNTIEFAGIVNYIAVFVICVCESMSLWNVRRSLSYVAIGGAVLLAAVIVLTLLLV